MYSVKTRNWNGSNWVAKLLLISRKWGVSVYNGGDCDYKFCLVTKNSFKAWATWLYFTMLKHFSGGWTYILRPGKEVNHLYKSIY